MNKKQTLILGLIGLFCLGFGLWFLMNDVCQPDIWVKCRSIDSTIDIITSLLFFALPLTVFSLITYKMREEVFRAWWRFARWWVLVIIAVTLLLERAGSGGGIGIGGAVSTAFDILILGVLYAVLIVVSLVQIVRAYLKTK